LQFNWRPGIGDPTIGGWVTVALYFVAWASCWKTAGAVQSREGRSDGPLWRAISLSFLVLGINKQMDLQTALTELGRIFAYADGWYEQRHTVQVYFIIGVAIVCLMATVILLWLARRSPPPTWLAILGSILVLAFVLIRAASFHHIAQLIENRILGLRWNGFWRWAESRSHYLGANAPRRVSMQQSRNHEGNVRSRRTS
jgi:hypothetical protein